MPFLRHAIPLILAVCVGVGVGARAAAQMPALPGTATPAPSQPARAGPAPDTAERLANVREAIARAALPGADAQGAFPDTPANEIADRMRLLQTLERSLVQLREEEDKSPALVKARREAEARADDWHGFDTAPPYSVPFVDSLEDAQGALEQQLEAVTTREDVLEKLTDRIQKRLRLVEAELRQANERLERASGETAQRAAKWQRDLAQLRSDQATAALDENRQSLANVAEAKAAVLAELRLLKVKLSAARANSGFSKDDLARINNRLDEQAKGLGSDFDRAVLAAEAQRRAAAAASAALATARTSKVLPGETEESRAARMAVFERASELAAQKLENANLAVEDAKTRVTVVEFERKAWNGRFELLESSDPAKELAGYERMVGALAALSSWNDDQKQRLDATSALVTTMDSRLRGATPSETAALTELRDIYIRREAILRDSIAATQPLRRMLLRWRAGLTSAESPKTFSERAIDKGVVAAVWAKSVWNYEIASVEDSFETAEGRKITAHRSITVGKTIGAVLLIVLGYLLCRKLAQLVGWATRRLLGRSPAYASIAERWARALLLAALVAASLTFVQIPLTVFAFAGGALAIGLGFGAQNLLKNLISGVMLLIEAPLRVGDLIEFGGMRGRVTNIGFRASIVRTGDGIETHIPNSTLIESNLTNLTYSSAEVRQQIVLNVEYGAPSQTVRQLLIAVAAGHPRVLKNPAPAAYLDDFADDAQKFRLTYWIEFTPDVDSALVATELREAIVANLEAAGIGIPFPQRALHFAQPMQVEIARARKASPGSAKEDA